MRSSQYADQCYDEPRDEPVDRARPEPPPEPAVAGELSPRPDLLGDQVALGGGVGVRRGRCADDMRISLRGQLGISRLNTESWDQTPHDSLGRPSRFLSGLFRVFVLSCFRDRSEWKAQGAPSRIGLIREPVFGTSRIHSILALSGEAAEIPWRASRCVSWGKTNSVYPKGSVGIWRVSWSSSEGWL